MKGTFFITGIDTNIGKSYATGWLAREWNSKGIKTITQKMIQTGNVGHSEDIDLHREIMGIPFTPEDKEQITFPIVYSYPASPHLAAEIDDRMIPIEKITESTRILQSRYDVVLLEGAGADGSYYSPIPDGRLHRRPTVAGYLGNVRAFRQHQPHAALYRSAGK